MTWWMAVAIVFLSLSIAYTEEPGHAATVDLQLIDEARVPHQVLEQARDEVTRIFGEAGLRVRWTDSRPRCRVTIVSSILGYAGVRSPVMGIARPAPGGPVAQIFFKQVQDFARTYRIDLYRTLAYVIAHEIGHVLLASAGHSATGVMQAEWDRALVRDAAAESLTFTAREAALIRTALRPSL